MKVVYETADYPEVLIKKGILEDSGIPVYVENLHSAGGAMPELGFTLGYKILVPDTAYAEAVTIVNDVETRQDIPGMDGEQGRETAALAIPRTLVRFMAVVLVVYFALSTLKTFFGS